MALGWELAAKVASARAASFTKGCCRKDLVIHCYGFQELNLGGTVIGCEMLIFRVHCKDYRQRRAHELLSQEHFFKRLVDPMG